MRFEKDSWMALTKARVLILVEEFSGWPPSSLSAESTTNTTHVCPAFRTNFRLDTAAWAVLQVKTYDIIEIVRTTWAKHLNYNKNLNTTFLITQEK